MFFLRKRIDNAIYLLSKIETNENNNNDRVSKRSRVTTSKVWVNFIRIGVKDAKENVTCNHHGQEYVGGGGTKVWTLTMSCHLPKCDVLKRLKNGDVAKMIIDYVGKLRSKKIDKKHVEDLLLRAIIHHGLSFNFLKYK